jgi:hypothetical protein
VQGGGRLTPGVRGAGPAPAQRIAGIELYLNATLPSGSEPLTDLARPTLFPHLHRSTDGAHYHGHIGKDIRRAALRN